MTELDRFVARHRLSVVLFGKRQRKDHVMAQRLRQFQPEERIVFIGKAQEAAVFRTEKRHNAPSGLPYPWIVKSTAIVNHYYIYDPSVRPFSLPDVL